MKKVLFLIFSLLYFTGCTVDYNMEIDNIISEDISIYENYSMLESNIYTDIVTGEQSYKSKIYELEKYPTSILSNQAIDIYEPEKRIDGTLYYDSDVIDDGLIYGINFTSSFDMHDIQYLKVLNICYDDVSLIRDDETLSINISGENVCFKYYNLLDEINIRIKTDYKVISNNAMSKDGKYYVWNINKDNYDNQSIFFEIDTTRKIHTGFSLFQILLIIFVILLLISGIIILFVRSISRKNNKV